MSKKIILMTILAIGIVTFAKGVRSEILDADKTIEGITFPKGTNISFYESGKIREIRLVKPQKIQGIKCAKGTDLYFYESGKLQRATLVEDQKIEGTVYYKGYILEFDKNGKVIGVTERGVEEEVRDTEEVESGI